jgi:predicted ATPase
MKITSIRLHNFKRFSDLLVRDIPTTAKLVIVVGPNGSGKSSLFDALLMWHRLAAGIANITDETYHRKSNDAPFAVNANVTVTTVGDVLPSKAGLYVRTAYRNDPDFSTNVIQRLNAPSDDLSFHRMIENDQTVSKNYQRLLYGLITGLFDNTNDKKSVPELREELIGEIRSSMKAVFGDLILNNISDPLGTGTFRFEKGISKSYNYKNLSGGEKAAFDLLLDLHIKKNYFTDAIYCIDELETHLHTRVQGSLLKEMVKIVPDNSQLWVTTHSLGVLRASQEMAMTQPASVCVIDFTDVDPDEPREIRPTSLGRVSWEKMLSIALDDLTPRVAPKVIVVCEGSSVGTRRKDFDAEVYNTVLGSQYPDVLFISGGSSNQVAASGISIKKTLSTILTTTQITSLCDRDDKSSNEIVAFEKTGNLVLPLRNLESYLFQDEVILMLLSQELKLDLRDEALRIKADALSSSIARGNRSDDLKSASGEIFIGLRRLLDLKRCGDNTESFMRDTLAPLITPYMPTYASLKAAIIDRLPSD